MKNWKFKVVKKSRGMDGKFFAYPAAATFETFDEAVKYARDFHREQFEALGNAGGHIYCVVPRHKLVRGAEFRGDVSPEEYDK